MFYVIEKLGDKEKFISRHKREATARLVVLQLNRLETAFTYEVKKGAGN